MQRETTIKKDNKSQKSITCTKSALTTMLASFQNHQTNMLKTFMKWMAPQHHDKWNYHISQNQNNMKNTIHHNVSKYKT